MINDTIPKMVAATGAGWAVSSADIETTARIVSLVVTTALSVVVFLRDQKRRKQKDS